MYNAVMIDKKDNVAVAIEPLSCGDTVMFLRDGVPVSVCAKTDISIYHKLAVCDIPQGHPVVKYGEHIGLASCPIQAGEHVHVHNVEAHREDLSSQV